MELDAPIRVGVIGAGLFGSNLIDQVERVAGMETAAVADVDREKAARSLERSGLDDEVHLVGDTAEADAAIADGDRAVLGDGVDLARADVDVVVEVTGIPEVGTRHAFVGITAGTHVVMVTVEADTVVGPLLSRLAERNGVTYSMAYGDQPALIVELCDWARTVGFDVVAAGKWNPYLAENHHATPEDVFERIEFDEAFVERQNLNPRMYNSFFDGTKVAVEMCAVANATGLKPDVPRMPPSSFGRSTAGISGTSAVGRCIRGTSGFSPVALATAHISTATLVPSKKELYIRGLRFWRSTNASSNSMRSKTSSGVA